MAASGAPRRIPGSASPVHRPFQGESDGAVLDRCAAGDAAAWDEIIERYGRLVFSIPRRYGLDVPTSEDVFQEAFVELVRQLSRIRDREAVRHWLITATQRICRRVTEKRRREGVRLPGAVEVESPPGDPVLRSERRQAVREALAELGGPCQELLTVLFLQPGPVSYDDLSRGLGLPRGSIGPTRARCLMKLLKILDERPGGRDRRS